MEATETETLQEILDAEQEASRVYDEAQNLRNEIDAHITHGKEQLHLEYAEKVKLAITEAEKTESAGADAEISRIEKETSAKLAAMQDKFEKSREGYVGKLFGLVIGETDE